MATLAPKLSSRLSCCWKGSFFNATDKSKEEAIMVGCSCISLCISIREAERNMQQQRQKMIRQQRRGRRRSFVFGGVCIAS
mmetsp:Transcript_15342/g.32476  ORF Transcript_15342/g.32476 Transcript_15342/m.32476 type:complete len:81 (+) Transcript_15342:253-495(+)